MAYRRSSRGGRPARRPSNRRYASPRRAPARRATRSKPQTLRIVLETPGSMSRPVVPVSEAPRRARF